MSSVLAQLRAASVVHARHFSSYTDDGAVDASPSAFQAVHGLDSDGGSDAAHPDINFWSSSAPLLILPIFGGISLLHLLVRGLFRKPSKGKELSIGSADETTPLLATPPDASANGAAIDGQSAEEIPPDPAIARWKALRLVCLVGIVACHVVIWALGNFEKWQAPSGELAFYLYTSLLFAFELVRKRSTLAVSVHAHILLLIAFAVFFGRDVFPLGTFDRVPLDVPETKGFAPVILFWTKIGLLGVASSVVPFVTPRDYVPIDPSNPSKEPHPEQVVSLCSQLFYNWVTPLIRTAWSLPALPYDALPPLPDYDRAAYLVERASKEIYTSAKEYRGEQKSAAVGARGGRHIRWSLIVIHKTQFIIMAIMILLVSVFHFAAPLGLNRLLHYIETSGEGASIRPWVWVGWLFLGPLIHSVAFQYYIFNSTRVLVRTEAILTQVLFIHSLKARLTSAVSATSPAVADGPAPAPNSPSRPTADLNNEATVATEAAAGSLLAPVTQPNGESTAHVTADTVQADGNGKDAAEAKKGSEAAKPTAPEAADSNANIVGKINNLMSSDLDATIGARDVLLLFLLTPTQIILCAVFLYQILGWAALAGIATTVVTLPLPGWLTTRVGAYQKRVMEKTDARVQAISEVLNTLRITKLFAWEDKVKADMKEKREAELNMAFKKSALFIIIDCINFLLPILSMVSSMAVFTVVMGQELSASRVFSAVAVFDVLRNQMYMSTFFVRIVLEASVSLNRLQDFLCKTELLDEYESKKPQGEAPVVNVADEPQWIGFRSATFGWSKDQKASSADFRLVLDNVEFKRGAINLVVGPTGSGKSSLLLALLGEMHMENVAGASFNLPRKHGVAYSAQESWLQNETIRDNILFGTPFDEARYMTVIQHCALERDLTLFSAGDETEVGEKGLTLSGGQKARVALARAFYSHASIVLLDDILSALDVHTCHHIVDNLLKGDLVKDRTIILVTHHVALAAPVAEFVVALDSIGRVASQGSVADALSSVPELAIEATKEHEEMERADKEVDEPDAKAVEDAPEAKKGGLVVAEEKQEGHVAWPALKLYLEGLGGPFFWTAFLTITASGILSELVATWWLGVWSRAYDTENHVSVAYYLSGYIFILVASVLLVFGAKISFVLAGIRASRKIHAKLLDSILSTTLRWLDVTPAGRIQSRFTRDMRTVDGPMLDQLYSIIELTMHLVSRFIWIILLTPFFSLPGLIICVLGGFIGQLYIHAQLAVKRELSNRKSPVFSHFGAAIAGIVTIRAFGAQKRFADEALRRIDLYSRPSEMLYNLNRWVTVRVDALGAAFACLLAAFVVYGTERSAGDIGFQLTLAIAFSEMILYWVRQVNQAEIQANSLERVNEYLNIEQEPKETEAGRPPAAWPCSGSLSLSGLTARYSIDGPVVLDDVSFDVQSGEKVGVVGRTGSGKSTLTLALLRMIPTDGLVHFDGVCTNDINLDSVRSNISLIPQDPILYTGTLRSNLDPWGQHDDVVLNEALRSSGLTRLRDEGTSTPGGSSVAAISLDSSVASAGANFSQGQRQMISLARAMVRRAKVLILDEATASVDHETDAAIQRSIRTELKDVTLLTVAHRLRTVCDYDKIAVLDAGKLIEFDSPAKLMMKEGGTFRAMVENSGEAALLRRIANRDASTSARASGTATPV